MKSAFHHSGNKLVYQWRESIGAALFLTFFALIWNTISLGATYTVVTGNTFTINDVPYTSAAEAFNQNPIIVIFLIFPVIGFGFLYAALCVWLNRTTFSSDGFHLLKKTSPLPVKGDLELSRSSLVKVFVKKGTSPQTKKVTESFKVSAKLIDGKEIDILNVGLSFQDASLLENWINERLSLSRLAD